MIALWALTVCGFTALALRIARRPLAPTLSSAKVLLVRPVDTPSELEQLALRCSVARPNTRVILATPSEGSHPSCGNRKVGHVLFGAAQAEPGEIVISADADVLVDDALLSALAAAIEQGADIAVAPPRTVGGKGLAAWCLSGAIDQTPLAFRVQLALGGKRPKICGKAIAFSAKGLSALHEVRDVLAEDLALGEKPLKVSVVETWARMLGAREKTVKGVAERLARWMTALRTRRPLAFFSVPFFIAPTLPLVAVAAFLRDDFTSACVVVLVGLRALLAHALVRERPFGWVLGEVTLLAAWSRALITRKIVWRGRRLVLQKGGTIANGVQGMYRVMS
jgi:ceramide glucosyltransferase